jgi:protein-disulfide isomerase/uncharacterized membrane protein
MNKKTWFKQKNARSNSFAALKNLVHQLNVPINDSTIQATLDDHPDYPSPLAFCDALTEWKIDNMGVQLEPAELLEIDLPALTKKRSGYVMLSKIDEQQVHYLDMTKGWVTDTFEEFSKHWDGITILATADEKSGEKDYTLNRKQEFINNLRFPFMLMALLVLVIGTITTGYFAHSAEIITWLPLLVVKSIGIGLGALLMIEHIDKLNPMVRKLCGFSTKTSCQEVTESPAGTLFGWLSMAEVGLFYFVGGFLALALSLFTANIQVVLVFLAILTLTTLPYTLFSIIYQATVVKKYCPLCIGVMALFWVEFAIFISTLSFEMPTITVNAISLILWGFLLPIIVWLGFKPSVMTTRQIPSLKKTLAIFKGEPKIFDALLSQEQPVSTEQLAGDILLGDPNSPISIIMISSPFCGHCTPAFNALEKLISEFPEGVKVLVRVLDGGKRDVTQRLVAFSDKPELAEKALHAWYIQKKKDAKGWLQQFETTEPADKETIEKRLDEIAEWCKANEVTGTPTFFINGRKFPNTLKITDVKYYLRALFEEAEAK